MSTASWSSHATGYAEAPSESVGQSIRRYSNLVATIALVLAITIGGWLAMSQLPGGGGRFAALQGTPEAAQAQTCDVEPLTVDEVMEIVKNPYRYLYDRADTEARESSSYVLMAQQDLAVGNLIPNRWEADLVNRVTPSRQEFDQASAVVDLYVGCADGATYGQYWALVHPLWVQSSILNSFPVFADEQSVREFVEQAVDAPIDTNGNRLDVFHDVYGDVIISANPEIGMAEKILWSTSSEPTVVMGVRITDASGEMIMGTTSTGFAQNILPGGLNVRPVVAAQQSSLTGAWYIVPWLGQFS